MLGSEGQLNIGVGKVELLAYTLFIYPSLYYTFHPWGYYPVFVFISQVTNRRILPLSPLRNTDEPVSAINGTLRANFKWKCTST